MTPLLCRLALLPLVGALLVGPARADDEAVPPLTEDALRVMLEEAAATPRGPLDYVVRVGALLRVESVLTHGSLPLTLAMFCADFSHPEHHTDRRLTPTDIVPLLEGPEGRRDATLSMLRVGAQRDLEIKVEGQRAKGSVTFWLDARLHGRIEWRAEIEDGAWAITDLLLPGTHRGVTRRGKRWFLKWGAFARPASALVVPPDDLPELGLLGVVKDHSPLYPDDVLHLTVGILGDVFGPQGRIGLDEVRALGTEVAHWMRRRGRVVLRAHAQAPWHVVGWTIDAVRAGEDAIKPLELYVAGRRDPRHNVAVSPPDPFVNEGVMTVGRLDVQPPDAPDALVIHLEPDVGTVPAPTVYRALTEALKRSPKGTRRVLVRVGEDGELYAGHVLRIADLALRAGARDIDFAPLPLPKGPHGVEFGPDHTSAHMVAVEGFRLRIGTTELRGDPPVPPVPPKEFEPAGADLR